MVGPVGNLCHRYVPERLVTPATTKTLWPTQLVLSNWCSRLAFSQTHPRFQDGAAQNAKLETSKMAYCKPMGDVALGCHLVQATGS